MSKKHRRRRHSRRMCILVSLLLITAVIAGGIAFIYSRGASAGPPAPPAEASFLPTKANRSHAPGAAPEGMVWIPGGEFSMGIQDPRGKPNSGPEVMSDARPIHRVHVDGFAQLDPRTQDLIIVTAQLARLTTA